MRPLVLILHNIIEYVKIFTDKNNKFISFCEGDKLLEKYKAIWSKIENLKEIELNFVPVSDIRTEVIK